MAPETKKIIASISLPNTSTIRQTMQVINRGAVGYALLTDPMDQTFMGVVSDGDIRRALLNGHGLESPISSVDRPSPIVGTEEMTADQIAGVFNDKIRMIPIVDKEIRVVDLAFFDPRLHIPVAAPRIGEKELLYVTECILTGWVSSAGKYVTAFEELFADFCGTKFAVATCNGTAALHLALLALGVGPGDEVIIPALTFIATANAVTYTGACPVIVDSESESWNIDPQGIERAITKETKAIIVVHVYGHPANMGPILEISDRYDIPIIEDAAEAHGATYEGTAVGGLGDIGIFSFYGNKIVTTGEGGMLVTDRTDYSEKVRILRDHGMSKTDRYYHPVVGYNYRMTNLQAALGVAQMEEIDGILSDRRVIADRYDERLMGVQGITVPPRASWAEPICWLYSILVEPETFGLSRDKLMSVLKKQGIETRPLFIPLQEQPHYCSEGELPISTKLSRMGLSLPSAMGLTEKDIDRIVNAICNAKNT